MCLEAIGWVCQVIRGGEGKAAGQRRVGRLDEGMGRHEAADPKPFVPLHRQ